MGETLSAAVKAIAGGPSRTTPRGGSTSVTSGFTESMRTLNETGVADSFPPTSSAYVMGRGYGAELIQENDATVGNTDVMSFLAGVTDDQIWFRHVGNDLEVSIIGTNDKALVQNWYLGSQYHVEQFKTFDGHTLLDSKVQDLVSAMASFTPPAIGQTTLPGSYQTALLPVIVADWGP